MHLAHGVEQAAGIARIRENLPGQVALGDGGKTPQPSEWDTRQAAHQQVVAARDIAAGSVLTRDDLTTARCGRGLPPTALWGLVGRDAGRAYAAGDVIEA